VTEEEYLYICGGGGGGVAEDFWPVCQTGGDIFRRVLHVVVYIYQRFIV